MPERWRFEYEYECEYECECECPPTLETEYAPYGDQTTSIGLSSIIQITPSPVTVILTEAPGGTTNTGTSTWVRIGGGGDVVLPGDCPVTGYTPIPTVDWLGISIGSLQTQTQTQT